jgi:uncharacterized membrane protein (UPF0127 family)
VVKNANPVFRPAGPRRSFARSVAVIVWLAALAFALVACSKEKTADAGKGAAVKTVADFFPIKVGERTVRLQLAVRSDEMQRGLMGRRDLGSDDGMIFVYEKPQPLSFWMRNTPTPLDIGFFGPGGALEEIYPLHPFDEKSVSSRSDRLQFAVEMNQGWYRDRDVKPGAKLDLKALAAALKARGFEPRRFGLDE